MYQINVVQGAPNSALFKINFLLNELLKKVHLSNLGSSEREAPGAVSYQFSMHHGASNCKDLSYAELLLSK